VDFADEVLDDPRDRLRLRGNSAPGSPSEIEADDPLRLLGDGRRLLIVRSEPDGGGPGPSVGKFPVTDERTGLTRFLKLWES